MEITGEKQYREARRSFIEEGRNLRDGEFEASSEDRKRKVGSEREQNFWGERVGGNHHVEKRIQWNSCPARGLWPLR